MTRILILGMDEWRDDTPMKPIHQIVNDLPWSEPKSYLVRGTPKLMCRAQPSEDFLRLWRDPIHKKQLLKAGLAMRFRGKWMVHWWSDENQRFNMP